MRAKLSVCFSLLFLVVAGCSREHVTAKPSAFSWVCVQQVEVQQDVKESGSTLPEGATFIDRKDSVEYQLESEGPPRSYASADFANSYPPNWYRSLEQVSDVHKKSGDFKVYKVLPVSKGNAKSGAGQAANTGVFVVDVYKPVKKAGGKPGQYDLVKETTPRTYETVDYYKSFPKNWYPDLKTVSKEHLASGDFRIFTERKPEPAPADDKPYKAEVFNPVRQERTVFTYTVKKWVRAEPVRLTGDNQNPEWPKVPDDGRTRVVKNSGSQLLEVTFTDTTNQKSYKVTLTDEKQFRSLDRDRAYQLSGSLVGNTYTID